MREERDKEWLPAPCNICGATKPSKFHMCPNPAAHGKPKYEFQTPCLICGTLKSEKFILCDSGDCAYAYTRLDADERHRRLEEAKAQSVMREVYPDAKKLGRMVPTDMPIPPLPEVERRCKNCSFFKDEWCQKWDERVYMEEGACGEFDVKTRVTKELGGLDHLVPPPLPTNDAWWQEYMQGAEEDMKRIMGRGLFGGA